MNQKKRTILWWSLTVLLIAYMLCKLWTIDAYKARLADCQHSLKIANELLDKRDAEIARQKNRADDREAEIVSMRNSLSKASDSMERAERDLQLANVALAAANAGLVDAKRKLDSDQSIMDEQTRTIASLMDYIHAHGLIATQPKQ